MVTDRIQELMNTTLTNIKGMINVDTVIGQPVVTPDKTVIIPFSKVSLGVFTGGGEYSETNPKSKSDEYPMSAGGGAGVSVTPMGFVVCNLGTQKIITMEKNGEGEKWIDILTNAVKKAVKS